MYSKYKNIFLIVMSFCVLYNCSSIKIDRINSNEIIDISGDWNDVDSQVTSSTMVEECLNATWRENFISKFSKKPCLVVGTFKNKSEEHINTQTITKDIEKALINSGKVKFIASKSERNEVREERKDLNEYSSEKTQKKMKNETGADLIMQGQINTIFDSYKGETIKYYQIELELIDLETNEKLWIGQKKIKKLVKKSKYKL